MNCTNESEVIRLVAGELAEADRQQLIEHLAECRACRQLEAETRRMWEILGALPAELPERDLVGPVLAAAELRRQRNSWLTVGRFAAMIALAAGVGYLAGRVTTPPRTSPETVAMSTEELTETMGLDFLGGQSGPLAGLFEGDSPDGDQDRESSS